MKFHRHSDNNFPVRNIVSMYQLVSIIINFALSNSLEFILDIWPEPRISLLQPLKCSLVYSSLQWVPVAQIQIQIQIPLRHLTRVGKFFASG